jgi:hypothetical protein
MAASTESTVAGDIVNVDGIVYLRSDGKDAAGSKMRTAKQGDSVFVHDVINTGSDGRIKVLMKDKSIIDLGPSALFKIDDYKGKNGAHDREVEVSMVYGTMRAAVTQKIEGKGKFKVKTPSATMGVRGTEFIVKSEIRDMKDVSKLLNNRVEGTLPPEKFADGKKDDKALTQVSVLQGAVAVGKQDFNTSAAAAGRVPASSGVVTLKAGTQIQTGFSDKKVEAPKTMDAVQMKTMTTEAKVVDNAFQKAVVIENPASTASRDGRSPSSTTPGSSSGPSMNTGPAPDAIHQVLASAEVPLPPPPSIKPADLNIPGSLGPSQIFNQPAINTQGTLKRLHVVIVSQ